jgi:hypothetical protein
MSELRLPTVALAAEILCADGRTLVGRIFVPIAAAHHIGPMRAEEWMNEAVQFFPFLPDNEETPVLLNKEEILIVSVLADADASADRVEVERQTPHRRVILECRDRRIEGELLIDMPTYSSRVLDYLNRPQAFLTLREGNRHHLVRKARISRVVEAREE